MIGNEFDRLIFRGQNKDYVFSSSFSRLDNNIDRCVHWVKKETFKQLFKQTPYYKHLPKEIGIMGREFEFDLEALAQHYEFKTNYLDITKDFNVALFFAYTDYKNGRYFPISFENTDYEPHLYISNVGHLHMTSRNEFKIVGFQVSNRPLLQSAMALNYDEDSNMKNVFTKIPLPKNDYFSIGVYNSFKQGYSLFKPDKLSFYADLIKESNVINLNLLETFCSIFKVELTLMKEELNKNGYEINEDLIELSKKEYSTLKHNMKTEIIPFVKNNIGWRGVSNPA